MAGFASDFAEHVAKMQQKGNPKGFSLDVAQTLQRERMLLKCNTPDDWENLTVEEYQWAKSNGDRIRAIEKRLIEAGYGLVIIDS